MTTVHRFLFLLFVFMLPYSSSADQSSTSETVAAIENTPPGKIDSVLAPLSDEHIRNLLINELKNHAATDSGDKDSTSGVLSFVVGWLHFIDSGDMSDVDSHISRFGDSTGRLSSELAGIIEKLRQDSKKSSFSVNILFIVLAFLVGFVAEKIFGKFLSAFHSELGEQNIPPLAGLARFGAALLHAFPAISNLVFLSAASFFVFIFTPANEIPSFRLLYMAILFVIFFSRIMTIFSRLIWAPHLSSLRLINMDEQTAGTFQQITLCTSFLVIVAFAFLAFCKEMGVSAEVFVVLSMSFGTAFLLLNAYYTVRYRTAVCQFILSRSESREENSWLTRQFASLWHLLALLYLFIIWMQFFLAQLSGKSLNNGALVVSLLVVPVFFLVDPVGQWIVKTTIKTLRIYTYEECQEGDSEADSTHLSPEKQEHLLIIRVGRFVRLALLAVLLLLAMSAWGYNIPYAAALLQAVFESLVTLAAALLFWRFSSSFIEKKIAKETPADENEKTELNGDWGVGIQHGRSYTLLPIVRKFIGSVLTVMVTLIILSSLGVHIGPLLAGAGVIGLAIGFGAQKLVSDVFSGFFYLLDDAFRIGEYLETGAVSGTVEHITLRNVMLRHHRGMLQIVPYSDLGSITNFMRGGIIVKFNLEFPFSTDIDLVRRVIKQVGLSMLEEDEFKDSFIMPLKSQGIRDITNSFITVRVKFTAKPGTHFLIRREAYMRITEALIEKGIHYYEREVVVKLPEDHSGHNSDSRSLVEAGAAAGIVAMEEDEKKSVEKTTPY